MVNYWFKNAIIYSLDVETFCDSNGDGIGDFPGLISRMDYLASLGITCLWLLPFYPSPNRDNGYDVKDYYGIDSRLGDSGDFVRFMEKAEQCGIRVIIDMVINHTSIEHPWFQEARQNKNNKYRDFYVWSDKPLKHHEAELTFGGEENSMWTFDETAGQYYLHRFYKEQPELNIMNPAVRSEILKIMGYWLSHGVGGFRIDAAAILIEPFGIRNAEEKELVKFLDEMRDFLMARKTDAILLAEVNIKPKEMKVYLSGEDRMHMIFNFYINQHLFLSLAMQDSGPLVKAFRNVPELDDTHQWLNFLRHHDELTLGLLSHEQRKIIYQKFGPKKEMQIYDRGIRRRIAPMVDSDPEKLRLFYSLLFSIPGVPLIRYGDEIGMGDDLSLEGRLSVRTPMQWDNTRNGGFSGTKAETIMPVIDSGPFGYKEVNVMNAQSHSQSLLNWLQKCIVLRKQCPEIGLGRYQFHNLHAKLLVHSCEVNENKVFFIHNLSARKQSINVKSFIKDGSAAIHLFGSRRIESIEKKITIEPFEYHWWRIIKTTDK